MSFAIHAFTPLNGHTYLVWILLLICNYDPWTVPLLLFIISWRRSGKQAPGFFLELWWTGCLRESHHAFKSFKNYFALEFDDTN